MGFGGPSRCILLKKEEESVDHLFINYSFSQECQQWMCAKLGRVTTLPNDILSLFQCWPLRNGVGLLGCLWKIFPSLLIWEIWKERNKIIFEDREMSLASFQNKVEDVVAEVANHFSSTQISSQRTFTEWDGQMRFRWYGLRVHALVGKGCMGGNYVRRLANWSPPKFGWYKLNFDGASMGNLGPSRAGCIIRMCHWHISNSP